MHFTASRHVLTFLTFIGVALFTSDSARAATGTATVGQSVSLAVTVDGTAPFAYHWFKDGMALTGATNDTFAIASVGTASAGNYYAVISNDAGSTTSDFATLTVNLTATAPVFTTQPVSQPVTTGASVTFTAAAGGSPSPTYQWQKNGGIIVGATVASYTISTVAAADAGTYTVVATNSAGSATSNGAMLTVTSAGTAPVFTAQPSSQTVSVGSSVNFSASASSSPTPTYQWEKNGVVILGATSASYIISPVASSDAGTYSVVAANSVGSATSNGATLTVTVPAVAPVFVIQPISQAVTPGTSVTFTAAATGSPAPTYQWKKNGTKINGANKTAYIISKAGSSDAGTYTVVATNTAGSATSNGAVLTVAAATTPVFTLQPASQTVPAGSSVTFSAAASGVPSPSYQWKKNGKNISGATSASYTIADVAAANAATYTVTASNLAGFTASTGAVLAISSSTVTKTGTTGGSTTSGSVVAADFNGGGQSDILWQNVVTGECTVWLMHGATKIKEVSLGVVSAEWQIAGTGDFNGDGHADILWQNVVTGERTIWLMNGTTKTGEITLGVVPIEWQIADTGDFNSDGHPDIVWQNTVTGERSVWLMNGTTRIGEVSLNTVSIDWQIVGIGDFDGDGQTDVLWQNGTTGESGIWLMNGTTQTAWISLGVTSTDWQIRGTGDFDGDGQTDILWQNEVTGERGIWLMNGITKISYVSLGVISLDMPIRN